MLSPQELYPLVLTWLQALESANHPTAVAALAHLVAAALTAQSLRPAALMRALLSPTPVPARQRYKRVARAWDRPWLSPAWLTPRLVRAALALVPPEPAGGPTAGLTHLALDSVRCGRWEVFTVGVVWHGRVLPVGWTVLAYPWPKGQVTPAVCALVGQVAAAWSPTRPVQLVADRGFPSRALFQTLQAVGWGWTIRLRATNQVLVADAPLAVRALLAEARPGRWTVCRGAYGRGPKAVAGTLVVGRGLVVIPRHQRTDGSQRHRARRHAERQRQVTRRQATAQETDAWVVLFTSHPRWQPAVCSYRRRWATEGSYRDAQSGWDGRHGWDLEPALMRLTSATQVERVVGLWAVGTLIQSWLGAQAAHGPDAVRAIVQQWTTTGRLSIWAQGQLALVEPSGCLRDWVVQTLRAGARQVAAAPPRPAAPPCRLLPTPAQAQPLERQAA
jgi:hypothetical protein